MTVTHLLWSLMPQILLLFPSLQPNGGAERNVTPATPLSDLTHRPFSEERRLMMKEEAKRMFYWGYDNYIAHAFPFDELNPINCTGRGHDWKDMSNTNINDVLGDYCLTLVDTLDTLAVMGNRSEFIRAVTLVLDNMSFSGPCTTVQVFEVTIRVLGSLLSAHLLILDEEKPFGDLTPTDYSGELLDRARDLALRLLPAFDGTTTGIPHPRVNLCHGVPREEGGGGVNTNTCTAGAGTLMVEFTLLSRLLDDPMFEGVARKAVRALWDRRHWHTGLVGNLINIHSGQWTGRMSGIGAGIDSFYEYLLKSYILFGEREDLEMFKEMYRNIMKYLRRGHSCRDMFNSSHPFSSTFFVNVDYATGRASNHWLDALSASFAGVQVLAGDLEEAICTHALYYSIWRRYEAMPERFDWNLKAPNVRFYPLRPELVESTYLLYQATQNPFYLHVGSHILESIEKHAKAKCGYATLHDVIDKSHEDRMESFFLSETCKYLYLLFDTENAVNRQALDYIFTTEGHVIRLDPAYRIKPWDQTMPTHLQPGEGGVALLKTGNDSTFFEHSCASLASNRRFGLPLPREQLGSIEALVGLHSQQKSKT